MRAQNPLSARQPANEHRRVLAAGLCFVIQCFFHFLPIYSCPMLCRSCLFETFRTLMLSRSTLFLSRSRLYVNRSLLFPFFCCQCLNSSSLFTTLSLLFATCSCRYDNRSSNKTKLGRLYAKSSNLFPFMR